MLTDKRNKLGEEKTEGTAPFRKRPETNNATQGLQPVALSTTGTAAVQVSQTETGPATVRAAESAEE